MKHYPNHRAPARIEGLTHTVSPERQWQVRCWLCFGVGYGTGLLVAAVFFIKCCS